MGGTQYCTVKEKYAKSEGKRVGMHVTYVFLLERASESVMKDVRDGMGT